MAWRWKTSCWNLYTQEISHWAPNADAYLLFQVLVFLHEAFYFFQQFHLHGFKMLHLLHGYKKSIVSMRALLTCINKNNKRLLLFNNAALLIFLLLQPGRCFLSSSNPSLICARRFCSDWM